MKFEFLDHPADVGFRAWGSSKEELFANCASALVAIIVDPSHASPAETWRLVAEGRDQESLLVNWLNEVLYFVDSKRVVFASFTVSFAGANRVDAMAYGEQLQSEKHPPGLTVKAVTYH